MPHSRVEGTSIEDAPEPRRRETWTYAGGNEITKVTVHWRTDLGTMKRGVFKVGETSENRSRCDTLLEQATHCQHEDRRDHAAEERRRHVHSGHADLGADESIESRNLLRF